LNCRAQNLKNSSHIYLYWYEKEDIAQHTVKAHNDGGAGNTAITRERAFNPRHGVGSFSFACFAGTAQCAVLSENR